MAATDGTILGQFAGASVAAAFTNPESLDLIQIRKPNDGSVIYNVDSTGVAHDPAASATGRALLGEYSGATVAAAFSNPSQKDLMQIRQDNDGSIVWYLDYLGVNH